MFKGLQDQENQLHVMFFLFLSFKQISINQFGTAEIYINRMDVYYSLIYCGSKSIKNAYIISENQTNPKWCMLILLPLTLR